MNADHRFIAELATPYRWRLLLMAGLSILSSGILLGVPWLAGNLAGGLVDQTLREPAGLFALVLVSLAAFSALTILNSLVGSWTAAHVLADLRSRVFHQITHLPISYHEEQTKGTTLALATSEIVRLSGFLTGPLVSFPGRVITAAGASLLLLRIDPWLALLVPLLVPIFYVVMKILGRHLRRISLAIQNSEAELLGATDDALELLPIIKSFTRERVEQGNFGRKIIENQRLRIAEGKIYAVLDPMIAFIAGSAVVTLFYFGARRVTTGTLSTAELFSFLFYAAVLTRPVGALAHLYGQFQTAMGTLTRLRALLTERTEIGYESSRHISPSARGHLKVENVGFAYPGRPPVLHNFSLEIQAGEIVALTGLNGAGKTTLLNLILRFHDPSSGRILLDGDDIAELNVSSLRRQIGLVPQRALLLNASVKANLEFGTDIEDPDRLERAIALAQARDFIMSLPEGLHTVIGDRGVRLSGGQRQRIALARALVKDPPILVLDEATSMFDLEAEDEFVRSALDAFRGRTVLLITHRPRSLALADRIIEIIDGHAQERGIDAHCSASAR